MMKRTAFLALVLCVPAFEVFASVPCTCRAQNVEVLAGETTCLVTPQGPRLARCEKVLNNTSWSFLDQPCSDAISAVPDVLPALNGGGEEPSGGPG